MLQTEAMKQIHVTVLDGTGDTKSYWDVNNDAEVTDARKRFKEYQDKGYAVFKVDPDGRKGERMTSFDPKVAAMIMVPRIVGG